MIKNAYICILFINSFTFLSCNFNEQEKGSSCLHGYRWQKNKYIWIPFINNFTFLYSKSLKQEMDQVTSTVAGDKLIYTWITFINNFTFLSCNFNEQEKESSCIHGYGWQKNTYVWIPCINNFSSLSCKSLKYEKDQAASTVTGDKTKYTYEYDLLTNFIFMLQLIEEEKRSNCIHHYRWKINIHMNHIY